jgi:hypothetical protein
VILSPTQIETFDPATTWGCNLKWWWTYVAGKRGPQDASMALGEAVHGTIETFLKGGDQGVLHDLAMPGVAFLAKIRPLVQLVEKKIEPGELEIAGVSVIGRIDALANSSVADVNLIDWKTTSNIARYAKTPGGLAESVQMMVYSAWLLQFDVNTIELTHGYFQTRGKKFEPVNKLVDRKHVENRIEIISSTVELMKVAGVAKTPDQVAPDTRKCRIGFGCPHRAYCPHAGDFSMASLLDAFKKNSPGGVSDAVLVPPTSAPAPAVQLITPPDQPKSDPLLAADPPKLEAVREDHHCGRSVHPGAGHPGVGCTDSRFLSRRHPRPPRSARPRSCSRPPSAARGAPAAPRTSRRISPRRSSPP